MLRMFAHRISRKRQSRKAAAPRRSSSHIDQKRALKHAALRDCGRRCVYCAVLLDPSTATLDHVYPLSRGGSHDLGNVVVACCYCNRLKGDTLPHEFFARYPQAGLNFVRYARAANRTLKRNARRAVSLALAA